MLYCTQRPHHIWEPRFKVTSSQLFETTQVLVEKGHGDPTVCGKVRGSYGPTALQAWQGPSEAFIWLLQQEHVHVDLEQQGGDSKSSIYHSLSARPSPWGAGPRLILDTLWDDHNKSLITTAIMPNGSTVLHTAFSGLCNAALTGPDQAFPPVDCSKWYELVHGLLRLGLDVCAQTTVQQTTQTPLDLILLFLRIREINQYSHAMRSSDEQEQPRYRLIMWWFRTLKDVGIDLEGYAEREQQLHPYERRARIHHYFSKVVRECTLHVDLICNKHDGSLDISWETIFDDLEDPLDIPGSWV